MTDGGQAANSNSAGTNTLIYPLVALGVCTVFFTFFLLLLFFAFFKLVSLRYTFFAIPGFRPNEVLTSASAWVGQHTKTK